MKKRILCLLSAAVCLVVMTACGQKQEDKSDKRVNDGWDIILTDKQAYIPQDAKTAFDNAFNKDSYDLDTVALLAEQTASKANYMFLCKDNNSSNYKIVIVHNNIDDVSQITQISYFDYTKYAHNNINYIPDKTADRWDVVIPDKETPLDEQVRDIYNTGIQKTSHIDYKPIALIGKQTASGTNYAVLAYGQLKNTDTPEKGIFLLTVNKDMNGNVDIPSLSYIDLKEYAIAP